MVLDRRRRAIHIAPMSEPVRSSPRRLPRRLLLRGGGAAFAALLAPLAMRTKSAAANDARLAPTVARAAAMPRMHALLAAQDGRSVVRESFRGPGLARPVNVKSVSKTILSALVGIALDRGLIEDVAEPIAPILRDRIPPDADPRLNGITVGHLLTMQAGLERTSGANYGRWVASSDWVRFALSRPFVDEPGGRFLYSTGSWHLLSAILTRRAGRSTLELARDWLGRPLGIEIPPWPRDPQGIYMGGNDMALSAEGLLRFAETYRLGGVFDGERLVPEDWVRTSWVPRTRSPFSGHDYGFGWFIARMAGQEVYYARGYGGQLLHVVPSLGLSVVMLSDPTPPSPGGVYVRELHALLEQGLIPALARA